MDISVTGAKILFTIPVLGGIKISETLVNTWLVMIVLTGLCWWLTRDLKVRDISKKQAVAEKIVMMAENLVRENMGEKWMHYVPFISAIFGLSIFSSLSSLLGLWAPTGDISTTMAWAIVVFVQITYFKLRTNGLGGYMKGFCDPIFLMAPFNVLGEVFTPISMAFRHFGNIVSGGVITTLVYGALTVANQALFGWLPGFLGEILAGVPFLTVGVPSVLSLYFDWFGSFMQAFIFCMLSMMYISTATD